MAQNWPGTPLDDDEQIGPHAGRSLSSRTTAAPPPAPANQNAPEQYPGAPVDAPQQDQQQPTAELPYDPLGQGDIGFASGDTMVRSLPPGNDEYTNAVTHGILTGKITSAQQLVQVAAQYGVPPESWDADRLKQVEDAITAVKNGADLGGVGSLEYAAPDVAKLREKDVLPEGLDAAARGAVPFGLGDELGAAVDTVRDGGSYSENLHKNRAVRDYDEENHFYARLGGEIVGSLALPSGVQDVARTAVVDTLKTTLAEELARGVPLLEAKATAKIAARAAGRRAATQRLAMEGGGYSAAYGAGSTDGNIGDRALGAAASGVAGTVLSAAGGTVAGKIAALLPKATGNAEARGVAQAAERQGIDLLPADVGGPVTRRMTGIAAQTVGGVQPIKAASMRMVDQAEAARDRVATSFGLALRPEAAGQQAISGAKVAINSTRNEARAFYASAEKATEGFKADPKKAIAELDQNIAELSETPGGADGLRTLQTIRDDLASGKVTVRGIRNMRTALRDQFAKDGLRGSDIERRVNGIVDAAANDVTDSLNAAGKGEAARLFGSGDAAWKARATLIDDVFGPIIGKDGTKSGEKVIKTLTADLQGNNARAVKFLNAMPQEQQGNIRASIIGAMGRASKGQQNAEGDAFSLSTFLTNWNDIGETAKAAYFGPEARAALNDLAKVAHGAKQAEGYSNFSNTGSVGAGVATAAAGLAGIPALVATIGAQYGVGRLLASPRFARWLARAPKSSLSTPAYVDRLSRIARAEPAIANDVLGLQQRLLETFSRSTPARLAADEAGDGSLGVPQGDGQNAQDYPGEELPQ
jgi:hypothetical protein